MKKLITTLFILLPIIAIAQEKETLNIKFSGFVTAETFVDTRKTINSREGLVMLYPAPKNLDAQENDINDRTELFMTSLQSRLRISISGFKAFGAKGYAAIEGDFIGTTTNSVNLLRLRHAFLKLDWEKHQLIAGKYWHPMFVTTCFPQVLHFGAAVPFHVLSRAAQFRYTYKFNKGYLLIAALSELDFKSTGPEGANVKYVQQAAIPEVSAQIKFDISKQLTIGTTAGYKFLKPYIVNANKIKTDKLLSAAQMNAWISLKTGKLNWNMQAIYGESMYNFVMLGGYGIKSVDVNGDYEYSNIKTSSLWSEVYSTKGNLRYGLFAGYTKNLGSADKLTKVFSRGTNIDYIYQFSPRVEWHSGKFTIGTEAIYTAVAYGTTDEYAKGTNCSEISGLRFLLHLRYNFTILR